MSRLPASSNPAAQAIIRQTQNQIAISASAAVAKAVEKSIARELPLMVQDLGKALNRRALPNNLLLEANQRIADRAHQAVSSGYRSRLPRGGTGGSSELSGTLGSALADPGMTSGTTYRVISFANPEVLNQQARHWYRVNYGARGSNLTAAGGHEAATYTVNIGGRPFVSLRDTHRPAALSWLPAAFFWGGGQMIATRGPATPRGKGSRAARFLDLGLHQVALEFPREYDRLFRNFVASAPNRANLRSKGINIKGDVRLQTYGYTVTVS
jgi:hypothetical protein